ncbi:MAG: 16S rRNA (cytosine(1402)-N(4))-methyltransferase RsmH [Candidatus Omnitrophota bacterium]
MAMWNNRLSFKHSFFQASPLLDSYDEEAGVVMSDEILHKPVMLQEVLSMCNLKPGMTVVDATVGMGGHAAAIAKVVCPEGRLICMDKDEESLSMARKNLEDFSDKCIFVQSDFRNLDNALTDQGVKGADVILFDLGISSYQLDNPLRGFSIRGEGPLDMRMDRKGFICAYDLINNLNEDEIAAILWRFGQERFSHRIAHKLVLAREKAPISSTKQLADIVLNVLPYKARFKKIHPATRTFQALRIAVNRELDALDEALKKAGLILNKGGRICVISFHSLEDRIVKVAFRDFVKTGEFALVFKKILKPSLEEMRSNPRSRSAKMRVIERIK